MGHVYNHLMFQEEDKSLYFTPDGSPHKDVAYGDIASPNHDGSKRKSHKRIVSNLSNFFPFWWGMGQSDQSGVTNGTIEDLKVNDSTSRNDDDVVE